ncbi:MAG: excinuclease ABC subunit C, partial [Bacteroidales bacterium]
IDIREKVNSDAYEIIVPFIPNKAYSNIKFIVPQRGDKKKLLDLSVRNAKLYKHQRNQILESKNYDSGRNKLLEKAQSDLRLKNIPHRIECFDNSNIQGTHPVASCVVFLDGKPAKKEYRYYNIKSVRGANDFASMEEVIERRYKRQINEKSELPDLIIIDGGKGQLHSAGKSLQKLSLADKIPAIGIAKKLERIYFPNDPVPVYLDKKSSTLKLIQNIRNEAHRFGINFHRRKRSSAMIKNSLVEITGIGEKTAEKILRSFHTMDELKSKSLEEIEMVVGRKMGMQLFKAIHKSN